MRLSIPRTLVVCLVSLIPVAAALADDAAVNAAIQAAVAQMTAAFTQALTPALTTGMQTVANVAAANAKNSTTPPSTQTNAAPVVSPGANQTVTGTTIATLSATVTDDGLPTGSTLTEHWSVVSGGSATFSNANSTATTATFDAPGTYVLRLTATDGALTTSADLMITVAPVPTSGSGSSTTPATNSNISAVWANEGGDKVSQDELRASKGLENLTGTVRNRAWDGTTIKLSGAKNEVVSFNLVLEAATAPATNVSVSFDTITGPNGAKIATTAPAVGNGIFTWVNRPIELFYVDYLQIKGLSYFGYFHGDERQIPARFRTPWTGSGSGTGKWIDRPDHDKFYPDPLVPLELVPTFTIAQASNQSIWCDIYVPKTVPAGAYTGTVSIKESSTVTRSIPVSLTVQPFILPDTPSSKAMVAIDPTDIMWRYVADYNGYVNWASSDGAKVATITDRYFALFHRHKITALGENECPVADQPCASGLPRLSGSLYTASKGYDGPGVNTPESVYSIGTYGTWGGASYGVPAWKNNQGLFTQHIDNWANWFASNAPATDYFLYLEDEPPASDYAKVNQWAQWMAQDAGPGKNMLSFSTTSAVTARTLLPFLQVPASTAGIGGCPAGQTFCDNTAATQAAADYYSVRPRRLWLYNDGRPGVGTMMTEADGTDPRTIPWGAFKKAVSRWFYWYANLNSPTDWFAQATTWGSNQYFDTSGGWTGNDGTSNGNGLLVYPGSTLYSGHTNYHVDGPIASLRLKEWRRGIQDVDYLTLAKQVDPTTVQSIVNAAMPKALWENPAPGGDPSYFIGPISWSSNPDDWEAKRAQLAQLISTYCASHAGTGFCQ